MKKRILLADANIDAVDVTQKELGLLGYQVAVKKTA